MVQKYKFSAALFDLQCVPKVFFRDMVCINILLCCLTHINIDQSRTFFSIDFYNMGLFGTGSKKRFVRCRRDSLFLSPPTGRWRFSSSKGCQLRTNLKGAKRKPKKQPERTNERTGCLTQVRRSGETCDNNSWRGATKKHSFFFLLPTDSNHTGLVVKKGNLPPKKIEAFFLVLWLV